MMTEFVMTVDTFNTGEYVFKKTSLLWLLVFPKTHAKTCMFCLMRKNLCPKTPKNAVATALATPLFES